MRTWYEKYGWDEDPFSVRPNENLVGLEKEQEKITNHIHSGVISLITGPTGAGKTSLLLWVEKTIRKQGYTPIRINCIEKKSREEIYKDIRAHRGFTDRILKRFPKKTVLLLDEAQCLLKDTAELIKVWWDDKRTHAVVLASIEDNLGNVTGSFMDRLKEQTVYLPTLSLSKIGDLIGLRAGEKKLFSNDAMEAISIRSENIPRRALEICRKVCVACAEEDIGEITREHVHKYVPVVREIRKTAETPLFPIERQKKETIIQRQKDERQKTKTKDIGVVIPLETRKDRLSLSRAQTQIVDILEKEEVTAEQLAGLLKTSIGSIRKQLSRLKRKNIIMIADFIKSPVTYKLTETYTRGNINE